MQSVASTVEIFRRKGSKITPQRRAVFRALLGTHGHPTVEEVYRIVVSDQPDISRTTVYNTMHELVALGELVEMDYGEGKTRYDVDIRPHHHLHCITCHALVDIHQDFAGLELAPEEAAGFSIVARRVSFDGYCPRCQTG
ncbi:Fur family transcriptional regulator [Chloroflexota bacterium]